MWPKKEKEYIPIASCVITTWNVALVFRHIISSSDKININCVVVLGLYEWSSLFTDKEHHQWTGCLFYQRDVCGFGRSQASLYLPILVHSNKTTTWPVILILIHNSKETLQKQRPLKIKQVSVQRNNWSKVDPATNMMWVFIGKTCQAVWVLQLSKVTLILIKWQCQSSPIVLFQSYYSNIKSFTLREHGTLVRHIRHHYQS